MRNGWFNLVLTLCAVRGFGRTMGDMKKPSSRGRAWLRGEAVLAGIGCYRGWRRYWGLLGLSEPI